MLIKVSGFVERATHVIAGHADVESCWWITFDFSVVKSSQVPTKDSQESEAHVEPWRVKLWKKELKSSGSPKDLLGFLSNSRCCLAKVRRLRTFGLPKLLIMVHYSIAWQLNSELHISLRKRKIGSSLVSLFGWRCPVAWARTKCTGGGRFKILERNSSTWYMFMDLFVNGQ